MAKKINKDYAYCKITKNKYIIMKRRIAPTDAWYQFGYTDTEHSAQALVKALVLATDIFSIDTIKRK